MDPPMRPNKRRAAPLTQVDHSAVPTKFTPAGSPSPFTEGGAETRRPRSSQTVSIGWDENEDMISRSTSRMKIDLAECVETKTVTTTTTTKRSYPPLLFQQQPLEILDTKEYPLALNPTPPELTRFSLEIDGEIVNFSERVPTTRAEVRHIHLITPTQLKRRTHNMLTVFFTESER